MTLRLGGSSVLGSDTEGSAPSGVAERDGERGQTAVVTAPGRRQGVGSRPDQWGIAPIMEDPFTPISLAGEGREAMSGGSALDRVVARPLALLLGALTIALVGLADYLTGIELSLEIFYIIPIYFVAWAAGRAPGLTLSAAAALTWIAADRAAGHDYEWGQAPYWNTLGGFLVFAVVAMAASGSRAWLDEMKATRTALARKSRELARSNTELEQFASVAAHDLKSPLVAVGGYVRLLQRRLSDQADPETTSYIERATEGISRMEDLITDLLTYARVAAADREPESVDLGAALEEALQNLAADLERSGGCVTWDPLPVLAGHRREMVQLFQNLVGNALKFKGEEPPRVHVGAEDGPEGWVIYVQDNGIGIEFAEAEKVFLLFERLHGRDQYPGTGVGLAICKKIVDARGGRIWVESEPGKGATFRFTLSPVRKV